MQISNIAHNKPFLGLEEANIASSVIESGWLAQGIKTKEFENAICAYLNIASNHAVAVSNGTSALYISLQILNLPKNSEVIIPTYVCSSLLNAIYMADLIPVVVDVNPIDFNIDINIVDAKITSKTRVIIIPHTYGVPLDIKAFSKYKLNGIFIIEDCATAIGAKIGDYYAGTFGDIAIFSFYASKFLTCGNGGMVVSNNIELINKARDYREFDGVDTYHKRFNFKITDIQAAIGIEQLKKIDGFLIRRKNFAKQYSDVCKIKGWDYQTTLGVELLANNYRFVLKLEKKERENLKQYLNKNKVCSIVPTENFELLHNYLKLDKCDYQVAETLAESTLSIPIYPALKDIEFNYIIRLLKKY
jgi:perosamine synthetase